MQMANVKIAIDLKGKWRGIWDVVYLQLEKLRGAMLAQFEVH